MARLGELGWSGKTNKVHSGEPVQTHIVQILIYTGVYYFAK